VTNCSPTPASNQHTRRNDQRERSTTTPNRRRERGFPKRTLSNSRIREFEGLRELAQHMDRQEDGRSKRRTAVGCPAIKGLTQ
jgi:hypothetical protein